ncbi:MAG: glycosyltransferase family 4 protein, partial [Chloroflexi bacterium]|nr:glycosyltransferase family 4 protein [Chloroflexota bacterium]
NAHIAGHGSTFDFLIFIPYVMGTTLRGAPLHPHNSIIWPCLHDEIWAYMAPTRAILSGAVGVIFNTAAEQQLMEEKLHIRHPHTVIAGMGFDSPAGDAAAFRQKYPQLDEPFFVYAGRLDASKNIDLLHLYFLKYQSRHRRPLNLALLGDGPLARHDLKGIFTLGFVDEVTKRNALAAAAFLCQPSLYESFSVVLMEAWAQGRPTLVHEHCPVTVNHVRQAQGGLYFANYNDFEGAIDYLLVHPDQANQMGANGRAYVRQHYNWPVLIDRLEQAMLNWREQLR